MPWSISEGLFYFRLEISDFDAGVKWILHKPAKNTRNSTSKKILDGEVVSLVQVRLLQSIDFGLQKCAVFAVFRGKTEG